MSGARAPQFRLNHVPAADPTDEEFLDELRRLEGVPKEVLADPHPGNVLVMDGGVIGLLDCGMVGRVDDRLRGQIEAGMVAVMANDPATATDVVGRTLTTRAFVTRCVSPDIAAPGS